MVCTGNACRSPMAAALLQQRLNDRGVDALVTSVGTRAWDLGATDYAIQVMREHGLDISSHQNRQLERDAIARADAVLCMTREHVALVIECCPDARGRVFLTGELARLGQTVGARAHGEPVGAWLARVAAARPADRPLGRAIDEIADPAGEPLAVYRQTFGTLDRWLTVVADLLAGEAPAARVAGG